MDLCGLLQNIGDWLTSVGAWDIPLLGDWLDGIMSWLWSLLNCAG